MSSCVAHVKCCLLCTTCLELLVFPSKHAPPPVLFISVNATSTYSVTQARKLDVILSVKPYPLFQSHFQLPFILALKLISILSTFLYLYQYHWRSTHNHPSLKPQQEPSQAVFPLLCSPLFYPSLVPKALRIQSKISSKVSKTPHGLGSRLLQPRLTFSLVFRSLSRTSSS